MSSAAILHNVRCELEAFITKRVAMIAANHAAEIQGAPLPYNEADFDQLAIAIRACAVDAQQF